MTVLCTSQCKILYTASALLYVTSLVSFCLARRFSSRSSAIRFLRPFRAVLALSRQFKYVLVRGIVSKFCIQDLSSIHSLISRSSTSLKVNRLISMKPRHGEWEALLRPRTSMKRSTQRYSTCHCLNGYGEAIMYRTSLRALVSIGSVWNFCKSASVCEEEGVYSSNKWRRPWLINRPFSIDSSRSHARKVCK